jgi:hypothetical protein
MLKNLFSKKGVVVLAMVLFLGAMCFVIIPNAIAGDPCEGNFDSDSDVDGSDLAVFAADFGRTDCPPNEFAPVEKTGQTKCYDTDGNEISCAGTGQDGDLKKGVVWPNPRFTDNGDGTVTDSLTKLIWLKNANCFGSRSWADALSDCNALADEECGLTDDSSAGDWRLPNMKELASLFNFGFVGPALCNTAGTGQWAEGDPFTNVPSNGVYYSSSTVIGTGDRPKSAWIVNTYGGTISNCGKTITRKVWPVRGGQ